jgi:hypothetical protein
MLARLFISSNLVSDLALTLDLAEELRRLINPTFYDLFSTPSDTFLANTIELTGITGGLFLGVNKL